jgi:hypothetical protein
MPSNMQIAQTLLLQLGGARFTKMTGAKHYLCIEQGLTFSLPSNFAKDGINRVNITLDWTDTYNVEVGKVTRKPTPKYETIRKVDMIYADDLQRVFTELTGLDTHL